MSNGGDDMPLFITEYQFRPVRREHITDWYHWIVKVVPFDVENDEWGVASMFEWIDDSDAWTWSKDEAWRGPLSEALVRGDTAQWTLEVNNLTAQDILDRVARGEYGHDDT